MRETAPSIEHDITNAHEGLRPICMVLNLSGSDSKQAALLATIEGALKEHGRTYKMFTRAQGQSMQQLTNAALREAKDTGGIMVAAGGDGTVNAVASVCHAHDVPMGIVPLGTFNYCARELGIPTDPTKAIAVLSEGELKPVAAGMAGDRLFLNNASFGLYTTLIRKREEASSRFGRMRFVAAVSAMISIWVHRQSFTVRLTFDGREQHFHTSLVFIGNNTLQLSNLGLKAAEFTSRDKLAVVIMKPTSRYQTLRILLRSLTRTLKDEDRLEEYAAHHLTVESRRKRITLVTDGELIYVKTPIEFNAIPSAVHIMAPREEVI